jgi:hypothetical protein
MKLYVASKAKHAPQESGRGGLAAVGLCQRGG